MEPPTSPRSKGANVEPRQLPLRKLALRATFSPEITMEFVEEFMTDRWNALFSARLPYRTLAEHIRPADWWESVKERFAPAWYTRRWPIRYDHLRLIQFADIAGTQANKDAAAFALEINGNIQAVYPTERK